MIRHFAILSCIVSFTVSAETGTNMLVNGGFEDISENGKPTGWACGREWRVAEREGVDGSRALVYDKADPGKPSTPRQNVQLEKGRTYAIEADIRIDGTLKGPYDKGACVYCEWYGVSNKWLGGVYTDEIKTTDGGWRHVSAISSAIKTNAVRFSVGIGIGKDCTGKVAIDNVKLSRWYNPRLQGLYTSAYRNVAVDGDVEFMASLDMTDGDLAGYSGRFSWTGADGRLHTAEPTSMDEEFARLAMNVHDLAVGRSKVKFELIKKATGTIDSCKEIAFERSTELPRRAVTVDSRLRAVVDGKPFFPIGVYGGANSMARLKEIGINTLMLYGAPGWDVLECARTNGLKVVAGVNHVFAGMKHAPSGVKTEADEAAWMEKYVGAVRSHPALLAWYALDELPLTMLPRLSARRDLLERLDPDHPVWVCLNHPHQTRSYLSAFDISGSDPYPVPRDPIVTAARWAEATARGCGRRRAVWMVPQIFNWANYGRKDCRVPTREEMRNMTWQCIAEGATGLVYFKWGDLMNNGPDTTFDGRFADFASVVQDVRRKLPILLSDEPAPAVSGTNETLCARAFVKGGNVHLLVVNASREACRARVQVERAGYPVFERELAPLEVTFKNLTSLRTTIPLDRIGRKAWYAPDGWWERRHAEKLKEIANGPKEYDMVFVGDSITHNWEGWKNPDEARFIDDLHRKGKLKTGARPAGELWDQMAEKYRILNLGYGGDCTQHVLWRIENGELDGYVARNIMLMIGTNNAETELAVVNGVRCVVAAMRRKQPKARILFSAIFPRQASPSHWQRQRNNRINKELKKLADGEQVVWLDFNARFLSDKGVLGKDLFPDLLHPNATGYDIWWNEIKGFLE